MHNGEVIFIHLYVSFPKQTTPWVSGNFGIGNLHQHLPYSFDFGSYESIITPTSYEIQIKLCISFLKQLITQKLGALKYRLH